MSQHHDTPRKSRKGWWAIRCAGQDHAVAGTVGEPHKSSKRQGVVLARLAGLEPATCGLEVRCSIHLSYSRTLVFQQDTGGSVFCVPPLVPPLRPPGRKPAALGTAYHASTPRQRALPVSSGRADGGPAAPSGFFSMVLTKEPRDGASSSPTDRECRCRRSAHASSRGSLPEVPARAT